MSSPRGSVREGTRIVLKEITATLHNSSPIHPSRRKNGTDSPVTVPKTAEHEVKVQFAREFADVGSVTENLCLVPESLSSASSFHSLSSTLSTKSSSGICPDSTPEIPDDADSGNTSYINSNIPGVEDLILACAEIHLGSERDSQDLSQDRTFASAIDELPLSTSDCSLNEDLSDNTENETQLIKTDSQLYQTCVPLNQTRIVELSNNAASVQDSQFVISYPLEEDIPQVKESSDKHILFQESDNIANELETCNIANNIIKDSLPTNNVNNNQLNVTSIISSDNSTFNIIVRSEKQAIKDDCITEVLPLEDPQLCPTEISVPSISSLAQYADISLPNISSISSPLEDTNNKTKETNVQNLQEQEISTALSFSDDFDKKLCTLSQTIVNNSDQTDQTEKNEIVKEQELSQLDNFIVSNKENNTEILKTSIIEPKTPEIKEHLQTNIDEKNLEIKNTIVLNETQKLSEEEIITCNKTCITEKQSETVIIKKEENIVENATVTSAVKKETSFEGDLNRTLTLQEIDINFAIDEEYEDFKPQRQSTALTLINEQPCFEEIKSTVEKVTNELLNPSSELTEETDQFVSATVEIFQDPSVFDFLLAQSNSTHTDRLRTESLYVKFDPLVSRSSMLPQGNVQSINEEKNDKNESSLSDVGTPKRNPAIAAIDRLLFYSPLPNATVQKLEEAQEKNEQPVEEPKSDAPLIDQVEMSKELELVRTTVLQLEEELEKQKKEHDKKEAELERQKAVFQEKINKLQTQISQEIKTKTQMTVVVEEYEKSISRLLTERERDRTSFEQDKAKLQEELQTANRHLTNTEAAFNDVHQKYERLKGVVSVYKSNEAVLKESIQENVETIKTLETRYDQLKEHAMAQLENANLELDAIRKQNEAETVKLHALIRKAELKSNSLAELVEQKTKENKELAKILDEVIARVGHGNSE
ncbi:hypothetical protein P5V15_013772 [Pogonomyrmex californicus]